MNPKLKNFIVRAITGVLYAATMILCFMQSTAMLLVFALIASMSVWEFCGLVNNRQNVSVNKFICSAASLFLVVAMFGYCQGMPNATVFLPYLITIVYLFVSGLYMKQADPVQDWAYAMMSQLYIALPLSMISILAFYTGEFYWLVPLALFVFLWANDSGAYIVGSLIGKRKLFPRISPAKSWEGSIGGFLLVLAIAALIWKYEPDGKSGLSLLQWLGFGAVVSVFGTWGDLVESLFKRTLGIKDSGNILPGHGGMLDRFDSSLLAIPASAIYIYTLWAF